MSCLEGRIIINNTPNKITELTFKNTIMRTGIIVPCYNEEKRLKTEVYLKFIRRHSDYHFCFVMMAVRTIPLNC